MIVVETGDSMRGGLNRLGMQAVIQQYGRHAYALKAGVEVET